MSTARAWLETALADLHAGEDLLRSGHCAHTCFFAHQAAEKAVKAVHYSRGARLVVGHGVRTLIERLESDQLSGLLSAAREVDRFSIATRYPNRLNSGTAREAFGVEQARRALSLGRAILRECSTIVERGDPDWGPPARY
ncbi:MAG: HEPN domain-containing protein [Bryobacterales bacterium]|nr:HEPN domain-containing protein [Bryobacterales bacterium]